MDQITHEVRLANWKKSSRNARAVRRGKPPNNGSRNTVFLTKVTTTGKEKFVFRHMLKRRNQMSFRQHRRTHLLPLRKFHLL